MIMNEYVFIEEKLDSLRPAEPNTSNPVRIIKIVKCSKGYFACQQDIKDMSRKLSRLLEVVNDWKDDEFTEIRISIYKALEETIKKFQSDVDFCIRAYRIEDEREKSELTKEITELIDKTKSVINTEEN